MQVTIKPFYFRRLDWSTYKVRATICVADDAPFDMDLVLTRSLPEETPATHHFECKVRTSEKYSTENSPENATLILLLGAYLAQALERQMMQAEENDHPLAFERTLPFTVDMPNIELPTKCKRTVA